MKRVSLLLPLALLACGSSPKAPDPITRPADSQGPITPVTSNPAPIDPLDAGVGVFDAGCCTVPFALPAHDGETQARLTFPAAGPFDMYEDDAGVWRIDACVPLVGDVFVFQVGFPTDDDAGVLWLDRVNDTIPTSTASSLSETVNVFSIGDGGACTDIDPSAYDQLPDAG